MSQGEIVTTNNPPTESFHRSQLPAGPGANIGAIAIESERAIAEAQGQLVLAKRFPRDLSVAESELMRSCSMLKFAEVAFYSVPRGDSKVSGESIRMAEELARVYGNFEFGHRELSRTADKSEVEVYAWDKEKNNRSIRQITVMHVRDTRQGSYKLRDQKDIDDKIANVASKQVRGRILALMPKWLVEAAKERCRQTLVDAVAQDKALAARVDRMAGAFGAYQVTRDQLAAYIGHPLDQITGEELVELQGVYNALKEGANPAEYFGGESPANDNAKPHPAAQPSDNSGKPHAATAAAASRTKQKVDTAEKPATEPAKPSVAAPKDKPLMPAAEPEKAGKSNNSGEFF